MAGPYLAHLKSGADLRTSYTAIRAGFVALALEKNRRATPYVDEARKLQALAAKAANATDLPKLKEIRLALLTAAGVSDKAAAHLEKRDQDEAVAGLVAKYLEPAGEKFVEELVFRFLLTRGDSLGGSMRNVAGALAVRRLTRSIISCLRLSGAVYWWQHSETKAWGAQPDEDADIEIYLRGLSWANSKGKRTLLYNLTVPAVRNNIDLCLLDMEHTKITRDRYADPAVYLALGELKGGIDPAGADEHWKTARTALGRIHDAFKAPRPATFFIGAAIEEKMANEIWALLKDGTIDNAANLTDDKQIASITQWLCAL